MHYLYYIVLHSSSCLCAAYLYYFSALTQIICSLAAPKQLVTATASRRPPLLNSHWWRSSYSCPPSTVDPLALPCPHRVHPTDQACQAFPSKPFFNHHDKCCEPYLPLQFIFEPTRQSKPYETVLSFLNRLPAPPSHF